MFGRRVVQHKESSVSFSVSSAKCFAGFFPEMIRQKDFEDVNRTATAIICDAAHIKHRSQIVGGVVEKHKSQTEEQNEIARDDGDRDQNLHGMRHPIVVEEETGDEGQQGHQDRDALQLIEGTERVSERSADGLEVERDDEDEDGEDALEIGAQGIGENDDRCEQRLSEHDGRFPEDESLSVGAVQETGDVVDHPVRVVVLRVLDDAVADGQRKSEREEDEHGPSQEAAQVGVGSLVASDAGVDRPVLRGEIVDGVRRVVHTETGQGAQDRLRERDVADVQDGHGAQKDPPEQVPPVSSALDPDEGPEESQDGDGDEGHDGVDHCAQDGPRDRPALRQTVHGAVHGVRRESADEFCEERPSSLQQEGSICLPATSKRVIMVIVHLTLTDTATAVTWRKFTVICAEKGIDRRGDWTGAP